MIRAAIERLRGSRVPAGLGALKLRAIDAAAAAGPFRSLADLGGVWAVNGGYSLYALDRHRLGRAVICDFEFTEPLLERAKRDPRVELVRGDFTSAETARRVGDVDALLMFDVLLHQVDPDWDVVLDRYAGSAATIVLAGPWWNGPETVRLLELGRDRYLENVPIRHYHEPIMDRLDEEQEGRGRPWRDSHDIWQWGITDADLRRRMADHGFRLAHHEHAGPWQDLPGFDDRAYVFVSERSGVAGASSQARRNAGARAWRK